MILSANPYTFLPGASLYVTWARPLGHPTADKRLSYAKISSRFPVLNPTCNVHHKPVKPYTCFHVQHTSSVDPLKLSVTQIRTKSGWSKYRVKCYKINTEIVHISYNSRHPRQFDRPILGVKKVWNHYFVIYHWNFFHKCHSLAVHLINT